MYKLKKIFKNEKGQGMVEYGLILALVSIVAILGLSTLGGNIKGQLEGITDSMGDISEPGKVPGYSDEEIDDLIKQHDFIPVATAEDLNSVRSTEERIYGEGTKWVGEYTGGLDKTYIQVADIDLGGIDEFESIGMYYSGPFTGTFDGGDYVISNLTINRVSESNVGLFSQATGATFKNVGLEDVNVTGGMFTGGLVGYQSGSSVSNSYATGSVTGKDLTGGLVGRQRVSSVTNSYATVSVTGTDEVGGLVGDQSSSSTVSNSYFTGSVTGTGYGNNVGGLVGNQGDSSTVNNSYATGSVTGEYNTGGLVGYQSYSSLTDSYATGTVDGKNRTGGLVGGQDSSSVSNSYATGNVTGGNYTGGLVGYQVGYQNGSTISDSYATGSVTGTGSDIGGLVGYQSYASTVTNSYATGSVTGTGSDIGGLVGGYASVTNSYYDTETTGQSDTGTSGAGKTTAEMKNKGTYVDWDFDTIWEIEDGQYPTLR